MMQTANRYKSHARYYCVIAALNAGELSEGQAADLLKMDRVSVREIVAECNTVATELWERFRESERTVHDDIQSEAVSRKLAIRVLEDWSMSDLTDSVDRLRKTASLAQHRFHGGGYVCGDVNTQDLSDICKYYLNLTDPTPLADLTDEQWREVLLLPG